MAIKGITTKLRFNDKTYEIGEPLEGLPEKEEASLVATGVAEYCEPPKTGEEDKDKSPFDQIISMSAAKIKDAIKDIPDVEWLKSLLNAEKEATNRKTAVIAIQERIDALETGDKGESGDDENQSSSGTNSADQLNFNPSDAVVR